MPGVKARLRGAGRILFGRLDDAEVCSFCARERHGGESIVAGPGVAICGACAHFALSSILWQSDASPPEGMAEFGAMVLDAPACLLRERRASIERDLLAAAERASCRVLGWSYACNPRDGDHLSVRLARGPEASAKEAAARFAAEYMGPRAPRREVGTADGRS